MKRGCQFLFSTALVLLIGFGQTSLAQEADEAVQQAPVTQEALNTDTTPEELQQIQQAIDAKQQLTAEQAQKALNAGLLEDNFEEEIISPDADVDVRAPDKPTDYDTGPNIWAKDVKQRNAAKGFAKIIADTPKYLAWGKALMGGSGTKFKWKMGPMFYRGRLGYDLVKILVIGQEGAQTENGSYRSFTGGTGGNMQNFLYALGIDESYLFINTFVYTINGQYKDFGAPMLLGTKGIRKGLLKWGMFKLAQFSSFSMDEDLLSPIVSHRHDMIDHVINSNPGLRLVVAVGGAAQDSLASYIEARGGDCKADDPGDITLVKYKDRWIGQNRYEYDPVNASGKVEKDPSKWVKTGAPKDWRQFGLAWDRTAPGAVMPCESKFLASKKIKFIKLPHPGSRSPKLESTFRNALEVVKNWQGNSGWYLSKDKDMTVQDFDKGFNYYNRVTSRGDYRFGITDIFLAGRTVTHRIGNGRNGNSGIRILFKGAKYGTNDSFATLPDTYKPSSRFLKSGVDVPYEPKKSADIDDGERYFDPGPGSKFAELFTARRLQETIFRGAGSKAIKNDKSFGAWAIYRGRPTGPNKVIVLADQASHDDLMVGRALMGQTGQRLQTWLNKEAGLDYTIIRTLPVDTMGASDSDVEDLIGRTESWREDILEELFSDSDDSLETVVTLGKFADDLQGTLKSLLKKARSKADVVSLTGDLPKKATPIARADIPYGFPMWVGTAGDRSARSTKKVGKLYKFTAPNWSCTNNWKAGLQLSNSEKKLATQIKGM